MTQRDKLLEKMRNNPWKIKFKDLEKVLRSYGFTYSYKKHHKFKRPGYRAIIIAAHSSKTKVHAKAVKDVLRIIEEIEANEGS